MAQVPEPYTLLVAVRSQLSLSLDSDSESSTSPDAASPSTKPTTHDQTADNRVSSNEITETQRPCECPAHEQTSSFNTDSSTSTIPSATDTTPTANTFLNSSFTSTSTQLTENMSMNITQPTSFTSNTTSDTEPFPDYNEADLAAYIEDEIAYREAFRAAMHQQIRTEKVDPFIEDTDTRPLDEVKAQAMEKLKEYLSDPHLHASTRERFISLTNMTVRLERTLFSSEEEFLSPGMTAKAQETAVILLGYAAWADGVVEELLGATKPVRFVLGKMRDENVSAVVRYRNMACVVAAHLKKPRAAEQRLLVQFAELYDKWVHDKFLVLRNAQILVEERLEEDRLQLTRYLHAIWAILSRVNESYAAYREVLNEIRVKYFGEIVGAVNGALDIFAQDLSVVI